MASDATPWKFTLYNEATRSWSRLAREAAIAANGSDSRFFPNGEARLTVWVEVAPNGPHLRVDALGRVESAISEVG
jgi:hypothetical protein